MGLPLSPKKGLNRAVSHIESALIAGFVFLQLVITANHLGIPFYLGYRKFILDITVISEGADNVLWAIFAMSSATLLILCSKGDCRGLKRELRSMGTVLYLLVAAALVLAVYSDFHIIAVISLAALWALLLVYIRHSTGLFRLGDGPRFSLVLLYGAIGLLVIEIASIIRWTQHLFDPSPVFVASNWAPALMEAQISNLLYPLLPILILFFAYSWLGEFTFKGVLSGNWRTSSTEPVNAEPGEGSRTLKKCLVIGSVAVLVALLIGYYNFAVAGELNPGFPGTDAPDYIKYLRDMTDGNLGHAMGYAVQDERFAYLVIQYLLFQLSGSTPVRFVTFAMPAVLSIVLLTAAFLLVRSGKSLFHAATAMVVSVLSFTVTVGLYAGFYANWLAFAVVLLFYGLLLESVKGGRNKWLLVPAALSSIAVIYIHLWTWILLIVGILAGYAILSLLVVWAKKIPYHRGTWEVKIIALMLVLNLAAAYLTYYFGSFQVGTRKIIREIQRRAGDVSLSNISRINTYLGRTFKWYVGGFYAYAPIFIFSILGVVSILDYGDSFNRLMLTWVLLCSLMIFFKFPYHARFLYMTPFAVYTTLGIVYGANKLSQVAESRRTAELLFWMLYVLAILLLLNYGLRSVVIKQFGAPGLTVVAGI